MAGIYCADIYCDDCTDDIKRRIARELWNSPVPRIGPDGEDYSDCDSEHQLCNCLLGMDQRDYDSGDYPKDCSDDEESDCPEHCGSHEDCINAGELADGFKYGYCFGNSLTTDGEDYVKEAVREGEDGGVAREVWAVEYDYLDFELETDCDN